MTNFHSDIAKAKNIGSAKHGVSHWLMQRISAVFLVPLYIWFICSLFCFFINPEQTVNEILYSPFRMLAFLAIANISLYHGMLGIKVIFEDYVHSEFRKNLYLIVAYALTIITMVIVSFALILNFIVNI